MKKIDFLGQTWNVPLWAKFITQNMDNGAVCVWENVPNLVGTSWSCSNWTNPGESKCLGHVDVKPQVMCI